MMMSDEKVSGLDALAREAELQQLPQEQSEAGQPDAAQPEISNREIINGALIAARDVFCLVTKLQSPKETLDESNLANLSHLWGKVCDKRGIKLAAYLGDYAPEIAAAVATITVAATVRAGVIEEIKERKTKEKSFNLSQKESSVNA